MALHITTFSPVSAANGMHTAVHGPMSTALPVQHLAASYAVSNATPHAETEPRADCIEPFVLRPRRFPALTRRCLEQSFELCRRRRRLRQQSGRRCIIQPLRTLPACDIPDDATSLPLRVVVTVSQDSNPSVRADERGPARGEPARRGGQRAASRSSAVRPLGSSASRRSRAMQTVTNLRINRL